MKAISIEGLVRWAVVDEWPKVGGGESWGSGGAVGNGWGACDSYAKLLAVIDFNDLGVLPDLSAKGAPHPDALVVADALREIGASPIDEVDLDGLVGDIVWGVASRSGDEVAARALEWCRRSARLAVERVVIIGADGVRRSRDTAMRAVVSGVVLGDGGIWTSGGYAWEVARRPNGSAVWRRRVRVVTDVDPETGDATAWGETEVDCPAVNGRRPSDAYMVEALVPLVGERDLADLLVARARWVVRWAILRAVTGIVAGCLVDHVVNAEAGPAMPWLGGKAPRVLPSLMVAVEAPAGRRGGVRKSRRKRLT